MRGRPCGSLGVVDDARIGATLQGRYRVERKLGEGGMGAVYEGEHLLIGRRVAIKFLHRELATDASAVGRFLREAKTATAVQHKHIVEVTDMGQAEDGAPYMVLEYLEGHDWAEELESSGPQSIPKVVHIIRQVCDALSAAHARHVIHRDLKPENIFLIERGGDANFVKVVDFGISKIVGAPNSMTKTGMVLGTPYFMSPEQARDSKAVDHRADLYSLGVILFQAITGRFPFDAETYGSLVVQICTEAPPPIRDLRVDVPSALANIVNVLLAKDPAERIQSAAALKTALAPFVGPDEDPALAHANLALAHANTALAPRPSLPARAKAPAKGARPANATAVAPDPPLERHTPSVPPSSRGRSHRGPWVLLVLGTLVILGAGFAYRRGTTEHEAEGLLTTVSSEEPEPERPRQAQPPEHPDQALENLARGSEAEGEGASAAPVVRQLSSAAVGGVIRAATPSIRACWEDAQSPLAGRVLVDLLAEPNGQVGQARLMSSTLNDTSVEACILRATRRLTFPVAERSTRLRIPFSFGD